jgi:hypothetical protein
MNEKRTAARIPLDHPVSLVVDGESIRGKLVNLSHAGALFSFDGDERSRVDQSLLGFDGSFRIKPKGRNTRLYTGELVRFYVRDDLSYIAILFRESYKEIADG